jgi:Actin like proteins N terminal domain
MKVVFDLGNGYGKLVTPSGLAVSPSWVAPVVDRSQAGGSRVIEYVSGLNPHLKYGAMFAGGVDAQTYLSKASQRVGDFADSTGKSKLGLQLLASMLAAGNTHIDELIISCPDRDIHQAGINQAFLGRHDLRCNGQGYSIAIDSVKVTNEGMGIAAYALYTGQVKDSSGYIVVIDVGYQTAIMSAYTSGGEEITSLRHVSQCGASSLYQAIAGDIGMRQLLGRAPKLSLIEQALRDPARRYGKGIDAPQIDSICRRHHEPWLNQLFTPMFEKLKAESDETSAILFAGGGANLTLPLHGISRKVCPLDRPQDANALGLAMIAGIQVPQPVAA